MIYDFWISLTLTNPRYVMLVALVAAAAWVVAEFISRKASLRVACGIAIIATLALNHVLTLRRLHSAISLHQSALKAIQGHIEAGDPKEVSRAIGIHNQELEATGDSFMAAEALFHELGRKWN